MSSLPQHLLAAQLAVAKALSLQDARGNDAQKEPTIDTVRDRQVEIDKQKYVDKDTL